MNTGAIAPLIYNPAGATIPNTGIDAEDLKKLAPRLEGARAQTLADLELWRGGGTVPAEKQPLDAGFMDLPERILAEYHKDRQRSELGRILATARRLNDAVDRVIVL